MRVFYDGYIYDFQRYGGINRYFNEIIARLPRDFTPIISTYMGERDFWPKNKRRQIIRSRPFARVPALAGLGKAWMSIRVATSGAALAHPTYFQRLTPGCLSSIGRPLIVTVHDMIHERFFDKNDPLKVTAAKRVYIERADAILCISESTRRDMLELYPKAEAKAFVTPLASSMTLQLGLPNIQGSQETPYFLYVGGRKGYKNFALMLTAWRQFSRRHRNFRLRVVGGPWTPDERRLVANYGLGDSITMEGEVADSHLSRLYHESIALVYPSLYEGFGIPVLEAMRCRTAVICSDRSSLPEVGGTAPLYFDPADPEALVEQMTRLAVSSELRRECVARGAERAREFSWEQTARLTIEVYKKVAGRS